MDFDKALENSLDECNKLVCRLLSMALPSYALTLPQAEFQITRAQYQELISIGRPGPRDRAFKAHDLVSSPWSAALQVTCKDATQLLHCEADLRTSRQHRPR